MALERDSLQDLEKHRLQLEENIAKLKKGLQHWRQWDAEYEALKEEIEFVSKPASAQDLARIRANFDGQVIDKKEIDDIFGRVGTKPAEQIVNLLSRRIDYVTKNIETLEKQIQDNEDKYAAVSVVSQPDVRDEDGLPITEIIEELDDDGNILSSRLQTPGGSGSQVMEILEKAGVKDLPGGGPRVSELVEEDKSVPARSPEVSSLAVTKTSPSPPPQKAAFTETPEASSSKDANLSPPRKKSVSFADGSSPGEGPDEEPALPKKEVLIPDEVEPEASAPTSRAAQRVGEIMRTAKEQEALAQNAPVIPENETAEDAFLRREMLKYGMEEVGAVVAELTLEEGSDDDEGFEEMEFSDDDYEEDDEEDKYGRFTGRMVDDDYMQRMLELEQKLGVKSRFTEGQQDEDEDGSSDDEPGGLGRIVISREGEQQVGEEVAEDTSIASRISGKQPAVGPSGASEGKKNVRFAESLDIAPVEPEPQPKPVATPAAPVEAPAEPTIDPLSDVIERTGPSKHPESALKVARKTSRFKKSREADTADAPPEPTLPKGPLDVPARFFDQDRPTAPTGPEGRTIAESVLERDSVTNEQATNDDFDDEFTDMDLADAYHRKRREFIQRHGGFLKEEERAIQPLDEADGGQKMSRFRAARLSKQ